MAVISLPAFAGKFNKKLSIGDAAPAWSKLAGTDHQVHALSDYKSELLVIIFTCNRCPIAQSYEARFLKFAADYKPQNVSVVAINVNGGKAESLETMTERAKTQDYTFDYLKDATQESAKAYGARTTPTVFLLDRDRKVIYMGAFDDNWQSESAVEHHYLVDAVTAALAGQSIAVAETRSAGCGIPFGVDEE
ncbi:MAG: thioredoxin family protein [Planctomycetaceae bacterium]